MLAAAWGLAGARRMVLSGAPEGLAAAAGGLVLSERRQPAPFVDLAALDGTGGDFLASRSRNTRAQIRRSMRHFEGRWGRLRLSRPSGPGEAYAWLEEMIGLHAASWQRRGRPGAFAGAFMRRFHAALVAEAAARGELDLVRLTAGGETLGLLYGFRHRGVVYAYQGGFRSFPGEPDARPGLVAHALAIEQARGAGLARYDFLAGDARYKRSLATGETVLAWTRLVRPSLAGWAEAGLRRALSALRARGRLSSGR
jgi:CelD/BcsL family acetyltransferase involved in cellulose biosynthesis